MNRHLKTYLLRLLLLTLLLAAAGSLLFLSVAKVHYFKLFPFILVFFFFFSFLTHFYHVKFSGHDLAGFARSHMVVTFVRLVVYSAVVVLYLIFSGIKPASFVVVVVVLYLSYTIFETRATTRFFKDIDSHKH